MRKLIDRIMKIISNEYFLVSIVLILGLVVRLYKIDNPVADWHSWRQADTASVTREYLKRDIDLLFPRYHDLSSIQTGIFNPDGLRFVEFPIYNAIHALLVKNFPTFSLEVWGRLLSIFSSVISIYLLFVLGKHFFGKWGGILAAFFFALLPFNIYFSRVILPEPMSIMFGLLSMVFFVKFIDNKRPSVLYISGVSFAVAMLVKPFIFFYLVPMVYLAHRKFGIRNIAKNPKLLIPFLVFLNIALLPFFAWRIWINQYPKGTPFFKWAFNGDEIRFKPSFWRWIFGERLGHLILGSWGLVVFVFGLLKPKKNNYFTHFFLLGMFFYVSIFATASVRHDYYQTFAIPAISLALAQGTLYLWRTKEFNRLISRSILTFSLFIMFLTGALQIREFYKVNHPEIIRAGEAIDRLAPEDSLVIASYNGDTAFLYQTKRRGWPVVDTSIDKLIKKGAEYFVSVNFADPDIKLFSERFPVVEKTNEYIIIDLTNPL